MLYPKCILSSMRDSRGADGVDTIEVDIWTELLPPGNFTAATMWQDIAPPDGRVWSRTGQFNVPMNVTFVNATTVTVRSPGCLRVRLGCGYRVSHSSPYTCWHAGV